MSTSPLETLRSLSAFLDATVSANVPDELRSEVRAAAKTLSDLTREIDCLPALLQAEAQAMISLQKEAVTRVAHIAEHLPQAIGAEKRQAVLENEIGPLSELWEVHLALQEEAEFVLVGLQAALRNDRAVEKNSDIAELLRRYYRHFSDQASARVRWQSVFPEIARPSEKTIGGEKK